MKQAHRELSKLLTKKSSPYETLYLKMIRAYVLSLGNKRAEAGTEIDDVVSGIITHKIKEPHFIDQAQIIMREIG